MQRPVPASAVARLHPLSTAPQAGVLLCAAEAPSRSCYEGQNANATRCRDASWSFQPCGCPLGFGPFFGAVLRYNSAVSQPTEGTSAGAFCRSVSWQCNRRAARVGIPAVIIGDGDADNHLGLTAVTSDDHFLATVDHPPGWFVVSISFDFLVLGARSGQGSRSLLSPRGYGDSFTAVNMSNDGSALDVVQYDAGDVWPYYIYNDYYYEREYFAELSSSASVTLNGIFDSRETLMSTGFQGALATGELGWDGLGSHCPQITICPQTVQTLAGPWGVTKWTCTTVGDPCSLPFVSRGVSFGACTQQFSDLYDTDGDGNLQNGHPRCATTLGESLCGPCSCGPGEEQGYVTSSVYLHTSPVALITCTPCAAGEFKLLGHNSGPDECEPCPLGFSSSGGATACTACVAGRYRDEASLDCKLCQPGFFQNGSGQTACEICGSGQYMVNDAQTACQMCSVGSVLIAADVGCQTCEPGSMASRILATACVLCSVGTFQELRGQSSCINCSVAFDPQALNAHLWTTMVSAPIDGQLVWHETPGAPSFTSCGCRAGSWADLHGQCHECGEGITCRGSEGKMMPSRLLPFFWDVFTPTKLPKRMHAAQS